MDAGRGRRQSVRSGRATRVATPSVNHMPLNRILIAQLVPLTMFAGGFSALAVVIDRRWHGRGLAAFAIVCCLAMALIPAQDPSRTQAGTWLAFAAVAFSAFIAPAIVIARVGNRSPAWSPGRRWLAGLGASYVAMSVCFAIVVLAALAARALEALT